MNVRRLPVLLLAIALPIAPAPALGEDVMNGMGCGLTSTTDVTDAADQVGAVRFGPVTVHNLERGDIVEVTVICTVQVGVRDFGAPDGVDLRFAFPATTNAGAVVMADQIRYAATANDDVYLCTTVLISGKLIVENQIDMDPDVDGAQCLDVLKTRLSDLFAEVPDEWAMFRSAQVPLVENR
jgi:hypothetical protein